MTIDKRFNNDGFIIIKKAIDLEVLEQLENSIKALAEFISGENDVSPQLLFKKIEKKDKKLFYDLCSFPGGFISSKQISTSKNIINALKAIYLENFIFLQPTIMSLFYNEKSTKRLQYKWHQESSYFQGIKTGFHLWFPVFSNIKSDNGPMLIAKGSHKFQFDYVIEKKKNSVTQLFVEKNIEKRFEIIECCCNRGDAIIFDHKTVHCTGKIMSNIPRIAGIIRYVDTLNSGFFEEQITANNTSKNESRVEKWKRKTVLE